MDKQLFVPDRIRVGFQPREGTYTGKLAYVIYYDHKNQLRKENSWENWRNKKIDPVEFDNIPTEGFVLNKGVGGVRQSYGWNARNEYIRVYDPRDFEFEISVANLLYILRECNCHKGKGLEGKFVYSWSGTELVLLPVDSLEYQSSKQFTDLQDKKIKVKDLIPGAVYETKRQKSLLYLGKFDFYNTKIFDKNKSETETRKEKRLVFYSNGHFEWLRDASSIAKLANDSTISSYDLQELIKKYKQSKNGSKPVRLFTQHNPNMTATRDDPNVIQNIDGSFTEFFKDHPFYYKRSVIRLIENQLRIRYEYRSIMYNSQGFQPTNDRLYVELESGSIHQVISTDYLWS